MFPVFEDLDEIPDMVLVNFSLTQSLDAGVNVRREVEDSISILRRQQYAKDYSVEMPSQSF